MITAYLCALTIFGTNVDVPCTVTVSAEPEDTMTAVRFALDAHPLLPDALDFYGYRIAREGLSFNVIQISQDREKWTDVADSSGASCLITSSQNVIICEADGTRVTARLVPPA